MQFDICYSHLLPCEVRGCGGSYYRGNRPSKVFEYLIRQTHLASLLHRIIRIGGLGRQPGVYASLRCPLGLGLLGVLPFIERGEWCPAWPQADVDLSSAAETTKRPQGQQGNARRVWGLLQRERLDVCEAYRTIALRSVSAVFIMSSTASQSQSWATAIRVERSTS